MAVDQEQRHCVDCQRSTLHVRQRTSEMWGCLITILTAGLWLPIWFLMWVFGRLKGFHCQVCGGKN